VLPASQKTRDQCADRWRVLCALVIALLIAPAVTAFVDAPAFAEVSPVFGNAAASAKVDDPRIQLAEANLPPGVGSLNDYMRQGNENGGGSRAGVPPQAYSPPATPPLSISPLGIPAQEWNRYADPNAERSALIGAAVVGALAVGLWAWQQHEMHQARRRVPKRFYTRRPAY
jgi:hypothetical protein